jgi:hypothetical protein
MKTVAVGMALCALFVLSAPREPAGGEVAAHRASARALVARGTLDIGSEPIDAPASVHLGRRYAVAAPGGALALVPAELLARTGLPARVVQLAESATAALLTALLCALFFSSLLRQGLAPRVALMATLMLALCTPLWVHARLADGTALTALLLFVAVHAARRGRALSCGLACGALALVDPIYLLPAVMLGAYSAGRGGNARRVVMAALPLVLGVTAALWHRWLVGAQPEPSGDLIEGVVGLLLSTGKSIFLFAPPLALLAFAVRPWWRDRRSEAALTLVVMASVVLGAARLPSWHGDPGWGPRRILPLVPLAMEPVALYLSQPWVHRVRTALLVTVLALAGFGVQLLGLSFSLSTWPRMVAALRSQTGAPGWFSDPRSDTHFIPQFSPITGHAWLLRHYLSGDKNLGEDAPFRLVVPNTPKLDGEYGKLQLDWWLLPPRVVR